MNAVNALTQFIREVSVEAQAPLREEIAMLKGQMSVVLTQHEKKVSRRKAAHETGIPYYRIREAVDEGFIETYTDSKLVKISEVQNYFKNGDRAT